MGRSKTNLAEKFPQLALEWHPILNGVLTPYDISPSGKMKVWWQCKQCNEPFETSLNNRSKGRCCPYCAGKRSNSNNSLESNFPELAKQWHEKNELKAKDVVSKSHKKVWWKCEHGHEWESVINNRTSCGNGCPYCSGRLPTKESSLGNLYPILVKEWHPTKNKVTPFDVTPFSHKSVWWQCEHGHEWRCWVSNRTNVGSGCPYCKGNLHTPETCLATTYPDVAAEWHPTKNDKTPHDVTKSGAYRAWWKCAICSHEWQTKVNSRTNPSLRSGCPKCKLGLSTSMPEIRLWSEMVHVFGHDNVRHRYKDLGFELDVFIPALKVGIEYDGLRWHKDNKDRDTKKYMLTKHHDIFLIRISEDPEAPADKVFVAKHMPLHLTKTIASYMQKFDSKTRFTNSITNYASVKNFQNTQLFKETYDAIRMRK